MTGTLANGYSFESTQRELSNEYQHDRVWMLFRNLCVRVLWTKVVSALKGLKPSSTWFWHVKAYFLGQAWMADHETCTHSQK